MAGGGLSDRFDVVVVGGGPGGYVAAIRAAQLGLETACVDAFLDEEGRPALGGTCLNVGCIPSKALLDSSLHYWRLRHRLAEHGIRVRGVELDLAAMQARKREVVRGLTRGIELLFAKHGITWIQGRGRLQAPGEVAVVPHGDAGGPPRVLRAAHVILATGSVPAALPEAPFDGERIVDSTGALALEEVPRRLVVVGGGVVGLELGSLWARLGARVTVLVRGERLLGRLEPELAREARRQLEAQGLAFRFRTRVLEARVTRRQVALRVEGPEGEARLQADRVLVAVGRRPNSEGLAAQEAGLALDEGGHVVVDELGRTNLPHVWAVGDLTRGPQLAHRASEQGIAVAERIAGLAGRVDPAVPAVIYTWPEIAWVGRTSAELEAAGVDFRAGLFPFAANGRARAAGEAEGLVKILAERRTDRILGVHLIGPHAGELVAEAACAMALGASAEDLARTVHAHPTLAEAVKEAALAVDGRPIHR